MYLAAIVACHIGFGDKKVKQHPLVCCFMKGARGLLLVSRLLVRPWDLAVVLEGLRGPPFKPLLGVSLKRLAPLLPLASARRVSDIHALSVHPECAQFIQGNMQLTLKSLGLCSPIALTAFTVPPGEKQKHVLCPVWTMRSYIERMQGLRRSS